MALAEKVKALREKKKMSQKQLSVEVELTQVTLSRIEHGHIKEVKSGALLRLANALDVSVDELLRNESDVSENSPITNGRANRIADVYVQMPDQRRELMDRILELVGEVDVSKISQVDDALEPIPAARGNGSFTQISENPDKRESEDLKIHHTIYIKAPVANVWAALTQAELIAQYFLCPVHSVDLQVGGKILFGKPQKQAILAEILDIAENERLVHSFAFVNDATSDSDAPSVVTYELSSAYGLTKIEFFHQGFTNKDESFKKAAAGWNLILSGLKTFVETGKALMSKGAGNN
jgi:uncharacterized protein YndB with AHSA1/START domain/transcriptional regulator with XRE-family HTH domain